VARRSHAVDDEEVADGRPSVGMSLKEREIRMIDSLRTRWGTVRHQVDAGMTTAEYAVGTLAACGFAVVLLAIVRSGPVKTALTRVITTALGVAG
jgi:Protein of unknown function (DUF4244)